MTIGINPFALGKELAMMSDQQLAQLAQQHSDDAVVMSALMAEKQRRQHIQGAAQAQQAPQGQQATVRDQLMQSMLPENTGVAQVAGAGPGYADGGIVAFADGGSAGGYRTGPAPQRVGGPEPEGILARMRREGNPLQSVYENIFAPAGSALGELLFNLQNSPENKTAAQKAKEASFKGGPRGSAAPAPSFMAAPADAPAAFASQGFGTSAPGSFQSAPMVALPATPLATTPPPAPPASRGGERPLVVPAPSAAAMPAQSGLTTEGLAALKKLQTEAKAEKEAVDTRLAKAPENKIYEEIRKDMETQRTELGADREEAKNMALLKLATGLLANPGVKGSGIGGALTSLGIAAGPAAEQYAAALKDIKSQGAKLKSAAQQLKLAEAAEAKGDFRYAEERREKAADKYTSAVQFIAGKYVDMGVAAEHNAVQLAMNTANNETHMRAAGLSAAAQERSAQRYENAQALASKKVDLATLTSEIGTKMAQLKQLGVDYKAEFDPKKKASISAEQEQLKAYIAQLENQRRGLGGLPAAPVSNQTYDWSQLNK